MQTKNNKAATAQKDASLDVSQQTNHSVTQTTTDSNAAIAPSANQSCEDSSHDLVSNRNNAIKDCGWKQVKGKWKFVGRRIKDDDLLKDLSIESVANYSDGDLIAAVRSHTDTMRDAIQTFCLTNEDRAVLYDELHRRFNTQHVLGAKRNGKPTLRQAFDLAGWNYDKARAWHSYWMRASKDLIKLAVAKRSQMLDVADGDVLTVTDDAPEDFDVPRHVDARVKEVSDGGTKVTLVLDANDGSEKEIKTPLYDADGVAIFKKVPAGIRIINEDDIVRFRKDPDGFAYRCVGVNSFKLDRKTPSLKQLRDDAEKKKKQTAKHTPATRTDTTPPTSPDGEAKAKVRKSRATKKANPQYRKDKLSTGEFAIMQFDDNAWKSIMIDNEAIIDARLVELTQPKTETATT